MPLSDALESLWADPPAEFRSAPFWSWNGRLEPTRLQRAIEAMHAAGMGGFFMHSRYGLKTAYLSDEWFTCVSACIDKARQLGMKAYLYDEDRWPSGTAGGAVTRDHVEFRAQQILPSEKSDLPAHHERLSFFRLDRDADGHVTGYAPADALAPGVVAFDIETLEPTGWHNDGAYVDTMNPDAVGEFIRLTHQAYADRYGRDFGELIPAIFTDEPNVRSRVEAPTVFDCRLPWTAELPREFVQRHGYDLRDHLPELFFTVGGVESSRVRHDFWQTVTELFVEAFSAQIGRWCGNHGIASTGHMLAEQTLLSQASLVGACMPHYEHMQWPGIDILTDQADELITAKQCSSVASQLGLERTLSELYGCTGWDWPLEGHKFVGDWHVATGINFRCPHLTHYGLAGGAKRDYPASIFSHSPWWSHYGIVEDYFARLNLMTTRGQPLRDVLVIHPIESAWGVLVPPVGKDAPIRRMHEQLKSLVYALSGDHRDWDFGDESLLARYGKAGKGVLQVGRMSYAAVVVPPLRTLRRSTADLLQRFAKAGGTLVVMGDELQCIDGADSPQVRELLKAAVRCPADAAAVLEQVDLRVARRLSVRSGGGEASQVWSMLREVQDGRLLFVQSHDRKRPLALQVSIEAAGPVILWDARTGTRRQLPATSQGGHVAFDLDLPPTGSALVTVGVKVPDAAPASAEPAVIDSRAMEGPFAIRRTEPNTLPLDSCRFRIGGGDWSEPVPTLKADTQIRAAFGLAPRINRGHQPWYLYGMGVIDAAVRGKVEMKWSFHVTHVPAACKLAIERPGDFAIAVNGRPTGAPDGWWVDEDIATVDIAALLQAGDNEVVLAMDYRPNMELEDLYLLGEFDVLLREGADRRVPGAFTLTAPSETISLGSWVGQGLDFYGGALQYTLRLAAPASGQRLRLRLPEIACTAAAVHCGGRTIVLPWAPFEADLTEAIAGTDGRVVVEVIGGRKNILGPLHTPWQAWTGPDQFMPTNAQWTDEYLLNDHGLMAPPVVELLAGP